MGWGGRGLRVLLGGLTTKSSLVRMQTVGTGRAPPHPPEPDRNASEESVQLSSALYFFTPCKGFAAPPYLPEPLTDRWSRCWMARWRPCWLQWCIGFTAIPSGTVRSLADRKSCFFVYVFVDNGDDFSSRTGPTPSHPELVGSFTRTQTQTQSREAFNVSASHILVPAWSRL